MTGRIQSVFHRADGSFYGFIEMSNGYTTYFNNFCLQEDFQMEIGLGVEFELKRLPENRTKAINIRLSSDGDRTNNVFTHQSNDFINKYQNFFDRCDFESILSANELATITPQQLGADGIEFLLKALFGFLGIDVDKASLNDFHKILINSESVGQLNQYRNDQRMMTLGAESSYIAIDIDDFNALFSSICHGRRNLNDNWKGIVDRFWAAKCEIAPYLTCIWLIICKDEDCIKTYLDEARKDSAIDKIPYVLKAYSHFVMQGNKINDLKLQRKTFGYCFDVNDIDALIKASMYFDSQAIPEANELIDYLQGKLQIDSDRLMKWFGSELKPMLCEKIVNYYWWKTESHEITSTLFKTLASVYWEYPVNYCTEIICSSYIAGFGKTEKESALVNNFSKLCDMVKSYKKGYMFINHIYNTLIDESGDESAKSSWIDLKAWIKTMTIQQFSVDIESATVISIFRLDSESRNELEEYYCTHFLQDIVYEITSEDDLKVLISKCEDMGLQFIIEWISRNSLSSGDVKQSIDYLIKSRRFEDAIRYIKGESNYNNEQKVSLIKKVLCENFNAYHVDERGYSIFRECIPVETAESILLTSINFIECYSVAALISIYIYQKEWIKAAYLFVPFRRIHHSTHSSFIEDVYRVMNDNGIDVNRVPDSHFYIVKVALRVLTVEEFDSFIEWTKRIPIPQRSGAYTPTITTFDYQIKGMIEGMDKDSCWKQLVNFAILTDNKDAQDSIRFCIIMSYIIKYGLNAFYEVVSSLGSNQSSSKTYSDYYASIWKGLLDGRYSYNFLYLTTSIIDQLPITFWNTFLDVAVDKNHVFSRTDLAYYSWAKSPQDYGSIYRRILDCYSSTRETVFLKIATRILVECPDVFNPLFENYLPFCGSGRDKSFLFWALINLLYENKYPNEIFELLSADCWRCTESENQLRIVLKSFCKNDLEDIEKEYAIPIVFDQKTFRIDVLTCLKNYPEISVRSLASIDDSNNLYRFSIMMVILKIQYVHEFRYILKRAPKVTDDWKSNAELRLFLRLVIEYSRKRLVSDREGTDDILFVKNRYSRIYASELLLESSIGQYDDESIVQFMRSNNHFSSIYPDYELYKRTLLSLISAESENMKLVAIFLVGFISNDWQSLIENNREYNNTSLSLIHEIIMCSNYRDLNIQLLKEYIPEPGEDISINDRSYLQILQPDVYSIINQMLKIYSENQALYRCCFKHMQGIARFENPGRASQSFWYLRSALSENKNEIHAHFDMYISIIKATSYTKTLLTMMSDEVANRRITTVEIQDWMPIFDALGELQSYYYLLAARFGLNRDRNGALEAFSHISDINALPKEWISDVKGLKDFALGKRGFFSITAGNAVRTLAIENSVESISFLSSQSLGIKTDLQNAMKSYRTILQKDVEHSSKLEAYKLLFSYVKKPEDLFDVYQRVEGNNPNSRKDRLTFNELIIEFGCLLIELASNLNHDEQLSILFEIFSVYDCLNDFNKSKPSIISMMREAEQAILETTGLSFDCWVAKENHIKSVMQHQIIDCPQTVVDEWHKPVYECKGIIEECDSEMEKLFKLDEWRQNWNLRPGCSDYEVAFVHSVDEAIRQLTNGVNLKLEIVSNDLDDGCVFYQVENTGTHNPISVLLDNKMHEQSARLEVLAGLDYNSLEPYENACFSNIVELRPGDICGQSYQVHDRILRLAETGNKIIIMLRIIVGDKTICCSSTDQRVFSIVKHSEELKPEIIPQSAKYETALPAFSRAIQGFGRESEKRMIREYMNQQLAIIYGPSRVGKSSLLNYISNDYLQSYTSMPEHEGTSVTCIRIADDRHQEDYDTSMLNIGERREFVVFDSAASIINYLFIAPLKVAFLPEYEFRRRNRCTMAGKTMPDQVKAEIIKLLYTDCDAHDLLSNIDSILQENNCQLWLLYDEFQIIVERWQGGIQQLVNICRDTKFYWNSIKLVICGSDDLVRLFRCENNEEWNGFVQATSDNSIFVGQLTPQDFFAMMNDREIWKGMPDEIPWSPSALELLYRYTGGNAICGKLFGNELLNKIRRGDFSSRGRLYPSDITKTAYELLNSKVGQVQNLLVIHNTKNLEKEMPYLLYIAHQLLIDNNVSSVSIRKIREFFSDRNMSEIDLSLKVLIARGIIYEEKQHYGFTTMFYYDFFKNQATDTRIKELANAVLNKAKEQSTERSWETEIKSLLEKHKSKMTKNIARDILDSLPEQIRQEMRDTYGNTKIINVMDGPFIERNAGTVVNKQQNIQVNIQNMTNAFATILSGATGDELIGAYHALPKIQDYYSMVIPEVDQHRMHELSGLILGASNEKEIEQYEMELEAIEAPARDELCSNYAHAIVNAGESAFEGVDDEHLLKMLHLSSNVQLESLRLLPGEFQMQFNFATILHRIFEKFGDNDGIDFCPVSLMYCKLVEAILKKLHTDLYISRLPNETINNGKQPITFNQLSDPGTLNKYKNNLTIGSFSYPIVYVDKTAPNRSSVKFNNIRKLCPERREQRKWEQHALALATVQVCRNKSAHESAPVTKSELDSLVNTLFTTEGLIRMVEIIPAKKSNTQIDN